MVSWRSYEKRRREWAKERIKKNGAWNAKRASLREGGTGLGAMSRR
jgi:hypothetical protein